MGLKSGEERVSVRFSTNPHARYTQFLPVTETHLNNTQAISAEFVFLKKTIKKRTLLASVGLLITTTEDAQ